MTRTGRIFVAVLGLAIGSCGSSSGPEAGSQTNWLVTCTVSDDCDALECLCGACSARCDDDDACGDLAGASCIPASDEGAVALCEGTVPSSGICLPRCDVSCPQGTSCASGVCVPTVPAAAPPASTGTRITVDDSVRHQTLVGFGASLAFSEDPIVAYADKAALYDVLFAASGLDALRLRNRHQDSSTVDLTAPSEIVAAATARLGRAPLLLMTSGSPPAALKANGALGCSANPQDCTLATLPGGGFDYAGFASYWRTSIADYAAAGIGLDYVGIQNNPDWVPPADVTLEACRFLPEEGTSTETVGGTSVDVAYPGYREALAAVQAAVADLPDAPRFVVPETSVLATLGGFPDVLDPADFDALAIHLYDVDASAVDAQAFTAVRTLAGGVGRPVFQTEMQAGGFETAVLVHHSVVDADAALYLQNDLVSVSVDTAEIALVLLSGDTFEAQGPYYALSHFAKHTDPGWVRIDATSESSDVLGSAWLAPAGDALTVVLVNRGDALQDAEVVLPDTLGAALTQSEVTRTAFDGTEREAALGAPPATGTVSLPAHSIATIAFTAE